MDEVVLEKRGTAANSRIRFGSSDSASNRVTVSGKRGRGRKMFNIDDAVFGYIRAVRALGRTEVNSVEIARALHLPRPEVNAALTRLRERGVRRAK